MANGNEYADAVFGGGEQQQPPQTQPQAAPGGEQGQQPQPGVTSPTDPADLQRRVDGWQAVARRIQSDPVAQMTLFRFGTQLMRPIEPGQTKAGHAAQALDVGATTGQAMQAHQNTQDIAGREQSRREMETRDVGAVRRAQVPQIRAETERITQRLPQEIEVLKAQVRHSQKQSDVLAIEERLGLLKEQITEAYGAAEANAKIEQIRADIGLKQAQGRYADAHAKQSAAIAGGLTEDWQTTVTKDAEGNSVDIINVNKKSGERHITRMNPPASPAEAALRAKQDVASVKGRVAGWWGGGESEAQVAASLVGDPTVDSFAKAERILTDRYRKGGAVTQRFNREGKPLGTLTAEELAKAPTGAATAPTGRAPVAPVPVPANLRHLSLGTIVPDNAGRYFEITPQGMQPSTKEAYDAMRALAAQKVAPAAEPAAPAGMTPGGIADRIRNRGLGDQIEQIE